MNPAMPDTRKTDPLHGVTLEAIVTKLQEHYGWEELGSLIRARCFNFDPSFKSSLDDLDGFFTFVVGTEKGFGVLRDPIACKPAVMAETDDYVAFASEYKSLAGLPQIATAKVWEPKPAKVYFWERS